MIQKKIIILFIFLLTICCAKEKECVIILSKEEVSGSYYFYFRPNYIPNSQSTNIGMDGLNSNYTSGKVSQEKFDQYEIGDEYCFDI